MKHVAGPLLVALLVLGLLPRTARAAPANWFRSHAFFEITAGPAWRVAINQDERTPGFQAITVGGELLFGLDLGAGFGIVGVGRGRWGRAAGHDYVESTGSLGAQLRLGERARIRLGADAGEAWLLGVGPGVNQTAALIGGWLQASLDMLTFGGRGALCFSFRLDVGGVVDGAPNFPSSSLGLAAGVGGIY